MEEATTLKEMDKNIREEKTEAKGEMMEPHQDKNALPIVSHGASLCTTQPKDGLDIGNELQKAPAQSSVPRLRNVTPTNTNNEPQKTDMNEKGKQLSWEQNLSLNLFAKYVLHQILPYTNYVDWYSLLRFLECLRKNLYVNQDRT